LNTFALRINGNGFLILKNSMVLFLS
jgi:hypothetical protein